MELSTSEQVLFDSLTPGDANAHFRRIRTLLRGVMLAGVKPTQMAPLVEALKVISKALGEG